MTTSAARPVLWMAALALSLLISAPGLAQQPTPDLPKLTLLGDGIYAWTDAHPSGRIVTNSLIVITDEGVLVADGQANAEATQKMVDRIRTLTSQPIRYVVVASDHGDHTGGSSAFPAGATFIAHPTSKANLERTAANPNRQPGAPSVRIPTELVTGRKVMNLGGREIHIMFEGRAHTGGDLEVYLPRERLLFMSEVYFHKIFPSMRTAIPSEWVEVLKKAEAMDAQMYVPGHGYIESAPVLKAGLLDYRRAMETVLAEATQLHHLGISAEEALKQADWGEFATWNSAENNAAVALQRVWDELDGKLLAGR